MTKDRWLAVNLSWSFAGTGHLYLGLPIWGVFYLSIELLFWGSWAAWLLIDAVSTPYLGVVALLAILLRITSCVHSFRIARRLEADTVKAKNPWLSVFLSRFIPGLGHLYGRRWVVGLLAISGFVALQIVPVYEEHLFWVSALSTVVVGLIILDAYRYLRKDNVASTAATLTCLIVVAACSQSYFLAKGLQLYAFEVFRIPSGAMEPTLMGSLRPSHKREECPFEVYHSSASGDRIVCSKVAYWGSDPERYDVVVFRFPLNQTKHFVKRVIGLPGERLYLYRGDVFVSPPGETQISRFSIARRPLSDWEYCWIEVGPSEEAGFLGSKELFERHWDLTSADESGDVGSFTVSQDGVLFTDRKGAILTLQSSGLRLLSRSNDLRLQLGFTLLEGTGTIELDLRNRFGLSRLVLESGKPANLVFTGAGDATQERSVSLDTLKLEIGEVETVDLGILDGRLVARTANGGGGQISLFETREELDRLKEDRLDTLIQVRMKDVAVRLRSLRIGIDYSKQPVRYPRFLDIEDNPIDVPADSYFMLGDDSYNSHDSRAWTLHKFTLTDGTIVECEGQELNRFGFSGASEGFSRRYELATDPDIYISADRDGREWGLYQVDPGNLSANAPVGVIASEKEPVLFPFVQEGYLVGKVIKIWWPPARMGIVR